MTEQSNAEPAVPGPPIPFRVLMKAARAFNDISLVAKDKACILILARAIMPEPSNAIPLAKMSDVSSEVRSASAEVAAFLVGVEGVVEANSFERMCLWQQAKGRRIWVERNDGYGFTVGYCAGKPVFISLLTATVDGCRVLFVEATSAIVDHDLIRAWLESNLPPSAWDGARLNMTDASNFHVVLHRHARATTP